MISHIDRRPNRRKRTSILLAAVAVVITVAVVFSQVSKHFGQRIVSPLPEGGGGAVAAAAETAAKNPEQLKQLVKAAVANEWLNYSVVVADLTRDFRMEINESVIYDAASVNKIPILAGLYVAAQQDDTLLSKTITLQARDIQDYGTGSLRYSDPGSTYSVKTLAQVMIKQSDNTAAYVLGNYIVGLDKLQVQLEAWGLSQTDVVKNTTSNRDMELLFRKIYTGKIANAAFTQEMLSFMHDTDFEDRLPALLPADAEVYHKIGTTVGGIHDAGIVVTPRGAYYIGIFTADVSDEPGTVKRIAEISKLVYDFMN